VVGDAEVLRCAIEMVGVIGVEGDAEVSVGVFDSGEIVAHFDVDG
jgi:hypothetical protein